jgi:hypothetical protein
VVFVELEFSSKAANKLPSDPTKLADFETKLRALLSPDLSAWTLVTVGKNNPGAGANGHRLTFAFDQTGSENATDLQVQIILTTANRITAPWSPTIDLQIQGGFSTRTTFEDVYTRLRWHLRSEMPHCRETFRKHVPVTRTVNFLTQWRALLELDQQRFKGYECSVFEIDCFVPKKGQVTVQARGLGKWIPQLPVDLFAWRFIGATEWAAFPANPGHLKPLAVRLTDLQLTPCADVAE